MSEDALHRHTALFMLESIWGLSREKIVELVDSVSANLKDNAQKRLKRSYQEFERIIDTVLSNREYAKEEQSHIFGPLIGELVQVFKSALNALIADMSGRRSNPSDLSKPWNMLRVLYGDRNYSYPVITTLVTYLRNIDQHKEDDIDFTLPTDHITGIETCGNIYTLVSILILSIYAYTDILKAY